MNKIAYFATGILALAVLCLTGCAPTSVAVMDETSARLPMPHRVLVYNLAVSPDEVQLDQGISARIEQSIKGTPRTEQEIQVGHAVANALSKELVTELQNMGIPAMRAAGPLPAWGNTLEITGQFISIDEGNRTERVLIGLGVGRTDIKAYVDVLYARSGQRNNVVQFEADARSGYKPGMAETMGVGAAAGNLAGAAAVSGGLTIGSEAFTATVEADAKRTAKKIAKQLAQFFMDQGWLPPGAVGGY
jgi:hypothetical protein